MPTVEPELEKKIMKTKPSMLICLKHPKYSGKDFPDLRCNTCCENYLQSVKKRNNPKAQTELFQKVAETKMNSATTKKNKAFDPRLV